MLKIIISLTLASVLFVGCGSSSKSTKNIDIADYLPAEDTTKTYLKTTKDKEGENTPDFYTEEVSIKSSTISIKINDKFDRSLTIKDKVIIKKENNTTIEMERFLSKGSTLYSVEKSRQNKPIKINNVIIGTKSIASKEVCKLDAQIDELDSYSITYEDDILRFECLRKESIETKINEEWEDKLKEYKNGSIDSHYNLSYFYIKKGIGLIVEIDNNCYIKENGITRINDKSKKCDKESSIHKLFIK